MNINLSHENKKLKKEMFGFLVESEEKILKLEYENSINIQKIEFFENEDIKTLIEEEKSKNFIIKELKSKNEFLNEQLDFIQKDYEEKIENYRILADRTISERYSEMSNRIKNFEELKFINFYISFILFN